MDHDGKIKLLSEPSGGVLYVDMETGQVSPPDDGGMSPLIISQWAIVPLIALSNGRMVTAVEASD